METITITAEDLKLIKDDLLNNRFSSYETDQKIYQYYLQSNKTLKMVGEDVGTSEARISTIISRFLNHSLARDRKRANGIGNSFAKKSHELTEEEMLNPSYLKLKFKDVKYEYPDFRKQDDFELMLSLKYKVKDYHRKKYGNVMTINDNIRSMLKRTEEKPDIKNFKKFNKQKKSDAN